jgi:hypothetical protein
MFGTNRHISCYLIVNPIVRKALIHINGSFLNLTLENSTFELFDIPPSGTMASHLVKGLSALSHPRDGPHLYLFLHQFACLVSLVIL